MRATQALCLTVGAHTAVAARRRAAARSLPRAEKVVDKARTIAAHLLEAAEEDLEFDDGNFFVKGSPDQAQSLPDVALQAYLAHNLPKGIEPALEATSFYDPENFVFPFGTHIAVVEVCANTGQVELTRYLAVDDVGNVINPMIVDGQVHGGIAQGVGQSLYETGRVRRGRQSAQRYDARLCGAQGPLPALFRN